MVAIGFSSLKRSVAVSAILCGALAGCASTQQQTSQAELSPAQPNVPHPASANPAAVGSTSTLAPTTAVASSAPGQTQTTAAVLSKSGRLQPETAETQMAQLQQPGQMQVQQGQLQAAQDRMSQLPASQPQATANQGQAAIAAVTGAGAAAPSASAAYAASDEPPVPSVVAIPIPNPSRPGEAASMQPVVADASTTQSPLELTPEMVAIQSVIPTPRPGEANALPVTELAYAAPAPQLGYTDGTPHYDFNFDTSGPTVVPAVLTESDNDDAVSPSEKGYISRLIQKYAKLYEVPESLIHRVVHRESRYNPKAYNSAGYFGLMQIKYNTAKSMGYQGPPKGLLDAETNIKYAAKYLRGAWMVADSKPDDAVALYARGYYYDAKNKGLTDIANGNY